MSDVGLTLILVGFGLFGTAPAGANQGAPAPTAYTYTLVLVAALSIIVWRWQPLWTFAAAGAAITLYVLANFAHGPILIIGVFAIFGFALRTPFKRGLIGCAVFLAAMEIAALVGVLRGERDGADMLTLAAWLVLPAAVGLMMRVRRGSVAVVRAEQARRAVSEEQLRMAQELHDVVGHGLAVIAMQAGVALHVLDRNPDKARESLEAIRATSREALDGLRAELANLRAPSSGEAAPRRPRSGLADLTVLVERVRAGGIEIALAADDVTGVPAEVDAAGYRIAQEALTNVLRHADTTAAEVRIRRDDDEGRLVLEVADRGAGPPPGHDESRGTGIRGMRARAEAVGGTLEAGPRPGGGFIVRARLPLATSLDDTARIGS